MQGRAWTDRAASLCACSQKDMRIRAMNSSSDEVEK